jgi:acetyl-CoA carboxylase biotin carboxylase subunit
VGTIEFLADDNHNFYFIEMNTRIQVEHPITEMVTGVDICKTQILLAAGDKLKLRQKDVRFSGHAIECRINAEDPVLFRPSPGNITGFIQPGGLGVRVDAAVAAGSRVLPHYDSLIAKLIVHGADRAESLRRLKWALNQFQVEGIQTNLPFHRRLLTFQPYLDGKLHTGLLKEVLDNA